MKPLTLAVMRAGLIEPSVISECQRWGIIPRGVQVEVEENPDLAIEGIQQALDAEDQVRVQMTDLDLLHFYLDKKNQRTGSLTVITEPGNLAHKTTKTVVYATRIFSRTLSKRPDRQYIIPWVSESIIDIMTNGLTYLRTEDKKRVYFGDVTELYFGDAKAFMVCTGTEENGGEENT